MANQAKPSAAPTPLSYDVFSKEANRALRSAQRNVSRERDMLTRELRSLVKAAQRELDRLEAGGHPDMMGLRHLGQSLPDRVADYRVAEKTMELALDLFE